MRFRKLRIAWSVTWGIAAVLLCVLWVRSYWWIDSMHIKLPDQRYFNSHSIRGSTQWVFFHSYPPEFHIELLESELVSTWLEGMDPVGDELFHFKFTRMRVHLPHWALIVAFGAQATVPWIPWRFSLRTLLIATTLVAVVLGIVVWLG
jgi:hypothetical protein